MKAAISFPDATLDRASRRAKELGMSRSEFFTRAADNYLDELDAKSMTKQMDSALEMMGGMDGSSEVAVVAGRRSLGDTDKW